MICVLLIKTNVQKWIDDNYSQLLEGWIKWYGFRDTEDFYCGVCGLERCFPAPVLQCPLQQRCVLWGALKDWSWGNTGLEEAQHNALATGNLYLKMTCIVPLYQLLWVFLQTIVCWQLWRCITFCVVIDCILGFCECSDWGHYCWLTISLSQPQHFKVICVSWSINAIWGSISVEGK